MSSYVEQVLENCKLSEISSEAMRSIEMLDMLSQKLSEKIDRDVANICRSSSSNKRSTIRRVSAMRQVLEEISEKKAQIALRNYDLIDQHIQLVDQETKILETAIRVHGKTIVTDNNNFEESSKSSSSGGRKRGRVPKDKQNEDLEQSAAVLNLDPNEPVYCICRRIAFGSMVACDNEDCAIEWFHCSCVNLVKVPKNEWLCPTCSQLRKRH